jgi:hypothetical protein
MNYLAASYEELTLVRLWRIKREKPWDLFFKKAKLLICYEFTENNGLL